VTGLNRVLSTGILTLFVVGGCVPPPSSNSGTRRVPVPTAPAAAETATPESPEDSLTEPGLDDSLSEPGPDDPDAPTDFTETATGLKYRILRKGDGRKPTAADSVKCHYRGTLDDGSEFDSSYSRGEPASFALSDVIAGWTQGLQLVGEGGKIDLEIPYQLGYGEAGKPPTIPPQATLHFIVELISVK
jgi:FKBP-type peptidyl-prolyl cis-trans isomerase FkpA